MFSGKDVLVEFERRHDELDRLGRERLIDRILEQSQPPNGQARRFLARLGSWLITLGDHLQALQTVEAQ